MPFANPPSQAMQFLIKIIVSAFIIAGVSELAKRFTPIAAILASLPLTSILAMIWLYHDTKNVEKISHLSIDIFWAVLPSLLFFIALPLLLKTGMKFTWAMSLSALVMFIGYTLYAFVVSKFGIKI